MNSVPNRPGSNWGATGDTPFYRVGSWFGVPIGVQATLLSQAVQARTSRSDVDRCRCWSKNGLNNELPERLREQR